MNLSVIKNVATRGAGKAALKLRKWAPEILTATGVVGVVASAVMASRATLQLEETLDKIKEGREAVDLASQQPDYCDQQRRNDLVYIYTRGTVEIVKLYAPAVTLGVASLAAILSSHGIMRRRNAGLVAAYKVLETSYEKYRERVAEHVGQDQERDLYRGTTQAVRESVDPETGVVPEGDQFYIHQNLSPYARIFDSANHYWSHKQDYNIQFLHSRERFANDLLHAQGYVFLNDVYESLGFPKCPEGQVVGWVLGNGDDYVSFDLPEKGSPEEVDYFYYARSSLTLDFNVDGVMWDKI